MGTPISSLPLASTPTGTEYVPIVQSGTTKRTTALEVAQTLLPITTDKISDANVTADKLAMDSVTTAKIVNANVTADKLASGAALANIGAGGITATQLAANAVTTAKIADTNITAAKLDGAQSGSAPIFGARAWVNFNGTGTVAIRASGNVSSITDNGVGDYTVNFSIAMPDANYASSVTASKRLFKAEASRTASALRFVLSELSGTVDTSQVNSSAPVSFTYTGTDDSTVQVAIFR